METLASLTPDDVVRLREKFAATGTRPGYCALPPGKIPVSSSEWEAAIASLPHLSTVTRDLGYERVSIVLLPFHETLDREAALREHIERLRAVLPILADNGQRLGLEYVAAPTRRAPYATHTLWNLAGTLELMAQVDAPNLGLMLDTFHWHGASETTADLKALHAEQVVVVHVNDALDRPLEEQVVGERALPGATGIIDSAGFFAALRHIGYEGPVTCEPMPNSIEGLGSMDEDEIIAAVKQAMDAVLMPSP